MKPGRATEPDNEKNQVCGLRARAKGLLADFAPPRKGGGEAGGIRYVAKTGKVLFGLKAEFCIRGLASIPFSAPLNLSKELPVPGTGCSRHKLSWSVDSRERTQ